MQMSFTSLTESSRKFLEGHIPKEWYGDDTLLREFLAAFMIPDRIKTRPLIKTTMSEKDIRTGIAKWKESTSTSPSGRHLGHYKAIIQDPMLLKCLTLFMHVAIKSGTAIHRWSKATNVMLEKDAGNPCIHRLRIIHLFEADFNLYMKMQWGKRLVRRATKHSAAEHWSIRVSARTYLHGANHANTTHQRQLSNFEIQPREIRWTMRAHVLTE
jgi:hypothetical protein